MKYNTIYIYVMYILLINKSSCKMIFETSDYLPQSTCIIGNNTKESFHGYELEMFREAM